MTFSTASTHVPRPLAARKLLVGLIAWYVCIWVVTAIRPLDPGDWRMENILPIVLVPALLVLYRRWQLSDMSALLLATFLTLHAVGAHYTYAHVPLGEWMKAWFGFTRNHYDRIVHCSFGLLLAYPLREAILRVMPRRYFWASYFAIDVICAFSAVYEIIEWRAAVTVAPGLGDAYLGTQGDIWDAQEEMAMAACGAVTSMCITGVLHWLRMRRSNAHRPQMALFEAAD
jgi:putative membrane protein